MLSIWLPLNGDLHNQGLSNITATNNGATVDSNGKIGKCYSFDGNDDFINLGSIGSYFDGSAFSICFWIFSLENKTRAAVFSSYGLSSTSNFFGLELNSSNNNYCNNNLRFDWLGSDTYSPDNFVTYNTWTHICVTYDGVNQIKMYKNGELIQTSTRVLNAIPIGNIYYLGCDSRTGSTAFNGKLNDFRIYNHCLSPRECKQVSTALVLHYPLNRGGFGQNNLLLMTNQGKTCWGWSGNGGTRTLSDDGVGVKMVATTAANSGSWSVITYQDNHLRYMLEPNKKYTIQFDIKPPVSANLTISIRDGNALNVMTDTVTFAVTQGVWNHVVATLTTTSDFVVSSQHIYITGIPTTVQGYEIYLKNLKFEEGENATPWAPYWNGNDNILTNTYNFVIPSGGGNGLTTDTFAGMIVRHVTPRQGSSYRQIAEYNNFVPVVSGGKYTQSFWAKGTGKLRCYFYGGNIGCTSNVSSQGVSNTMSDGMIDIDLSSEWRRYWVTHTLNTSSETPTNKHVLLRIMDGDNEVYVCGWKLEVGDQATMWCPNKSDTQWASQGYSDYERLYTGMGLDDNIEYDVSGYAHNGIQNGVISYTPDTAKYNVSTVFNGTDTFIEAPSLPTETKTISIWLKTTWSTTNSYQIAVHDKVTGLAIGWTSGNRLITYVGASSGGSGSQVVTTNYYVANQWNHIVVVKTGDTTRNVYINGQLLSASSNNNWGGSQNKLNIGVRMYNNAYAGFFNGLMSDFRAYATALSADDILELYNTPMTLSSNGVLMTQGEFQEA